MPTLRSSALTDIFHEDAVGLILDSDKESAILVISRYCEEIQTEALAAGLSASMCENRHIPSWFGSCSGI
jgi:hypothetical protein